MRKHTRRRHYELVNPIIHAITGAAVTDAAALDKLRLLELSALESFRTGKATRADWRVTADWLNLQETLCEGGIGPEALPACQKAQEALVHAKDRLDRLGKLGFSGTDLQDVRNAYQYFELQRTSISRSRLEQAVQKTANRIRSHHPSVKVLV